MHAVQQHCLGQEEGRVPPTQKPCGTLAEGMLIGDMVIIWSDIVGYRMNHLDSFRPKWSIVAGQKPQLKVTPPLCLAWMTRVCWGMGMEYTMLLGLEYSQVLGKANSSVLGIGWRCGSSRYYKRLLGMDYTSVLGRECMTVFRMKCRRVLGKGYSSVLGMKCRRVLSMEYTLVLAVEYSRVLGKANSSVGATYCGPLRAPSATGAD